MTLGNGMLLPPYVPSQLYLAHSRPRVLPISYKTVICNKFSAYGVCPYGEKCHFSHVQK